jgi:O-succinylbenzoate synthase
MAKAAVEMAAWDLAATREDVPLSRLLGAPVRDCLGRVDRHPGFAAQLADKVRKELEAGYRRIKIKVKPGWDSTRSR